MVIQSTPPRSLFNPHPPPSHPRFPLFGWGRWNRLPVTACLFVQTDFAYLPQRSCRRGGGRSTLLCVCARVCVCASIPIWHISLSEDERRIDCSVRRRTPLKGVKSPRRGALVHTLPLVSSASAKCCFTLVSSFTVSAPSGSFGEHLH